MLKLDAYQLKWIAITGMVLNHAVIALREVIPLWLQFPMFAAGGVTFPILAYLIAEGYKHTSSVKKYLGRILIFGLIAQPFHILVFRTFIVNIMFTIALGICMLLLYGKLKIRWLFWIIFAVAAILTVLFDWGIIGIIMLLMFHVISKESKRRTLPVIVAGAYTLIVSLASAVYFAILAANPETQAIAYELLASKGMDMSFVWVSVVFPVGIFLAIWLLRAYSGQRGKPTNKYLFYIAYPLHLVVLGGIAFALGLVDLGTFSAAFGL